MALDDLADSARFQLNRYHRRRCHCRNSRALHVGRYYHQLPRARCFLDTDIVQLPAIFHAQALNQANFVRYDEANTVFPTA